MKTMMEIHYQFAWGEILQQQYYQWGKYY